VTYQQNQPPEPGGKRSVWTTWDLNPDEQESKRVAVPDRTTGEATSIAGAMGTAEPLVSDKVRDRLNVSGLLEPDEVVLAYLDGQGRVPPWLHAATGVLLLPIVVASFRAFVLTDRHIYVFDMKFGNGGAVKQVRAKHPLATVRARLSEPRAGWRRMQVGNDAIYVSNRGKALERAEAIVHAGADAGQTNDLGAAPC
jgi:hypothetical protein